MADADELGMLRESVAKALAAGPRDGNDMASWWGALAAIGWGEALAAGDGLGVAEAVVVGEECGRAAAPLALPALVAGLAAEARGDVPGGGCVTWAPEPVTGDAVVAALDIADRVLVGRSLWSARDLDQVARRAEGLDGSVPLWRIPRGEDIQRLAAEVTSGRVVGTIGMLVAAAEATGLLDRALTETIEYAMSRTAFGRPIGSFQAVKHHLADVKVALESSRALVARAARQLDAGDGDIATDPDGAFAAAVAARHAARQVVTALQLCVQVHGGIGVTMECELHLLIRRATALRFLYVEPFTSGPRIVQLYAASGATYA